mgnify:FL=1
MNDVIYYSAVAVVATVVASAMFLFVLSVTILDMLTFYK